MLLFLTSSTRATSMSLPLSVATGYAIEKNLFCSSGLFFFLLGVFLSFWRFCFYGLFLDFWVFEVCDAKIRALVKLLCGWWCKDCSFVMDAFMLYRNRFLGSKCRFFFLLSFTCRLFFWKRILYLRNLGIW